jgi:hypothetical protein
VANAKDTQTSDFAATVKSFYEVREKRLKLDRESAALKALEDKLKYALDKTWDQTAVPKGLVAVRETKMVPYVEDWPEFLTWIKNNDALDCLQKRLTDSAIAARLADNKDIPGVKQAEKSVITVLQEKDDE